MLAEELINEMIPALTMKDSAEKAIFWMEELRTKLLPVIDHGQFRGFISEEIIFENNDIEKEISGIRLISENCYLNKSQHFFDIIKLLKDHNADMAAIVDDDLNYLGVVTVEDIMKAFSQTTALQSPGAILVISIRQIDYTLAEIVRLIEENNAKVLGTFLKNDPKDNSNLLLTIKVNTSDLTRISATLERFGYTIVARFQEEPEKFSTLERLDLLMKYINI
jgi:predicted transcriptional regulator